MATSTHRDIFSKLVMASVSNLKCTEFGCSMAISGQDETELYQIMEGHKYAKHCKIFEETNLGRLPNEILLKIVHYALAGIDNSKTYLKQRNLFKLGSVCKRLNDLTRGAEFYRDITLTKFCFFPSAFHRDEFDILY